MITGITGFLGSALARNLIEQGHSVAGTSSGSRRLIQLPASIEITKLTLDEPVPDGLFAEVDCVIHCAHDFSRNALQRNFSGTKKLFEKAKAAGVKRQAFITSYSATREARSDYGMAKFALEQFFSQNDAMVFRPGLVLGPGGLGGRLLRTMRSSFVFVAPGGRRAQFPYVYINDFVCELLSALFSKTAGTFNLFYANWTSFSELAEAVRANTGRPLVSIPLPLAPLCMVLSTLKNFLTPVNLSLPQVGESVLSFAANQAIEKPSDPGSFVTQRYTLKEIVGLSLMEIAKQDEAVAR